jgi:citrate lyase beta subunit
MLELLSYNMNTIKHDALPINSKLMLPLLYVPGNHNQLKSILRGVKKIGACNLAICLEDAVRKDDRIAAEKNLFNIMCNLDDCRRSIFIRPSDSESFDRLLQKLPLHKISGFILPKATVSFIDEWLSMSQYQCMILPIMESREALDPSGRRDLSKICSINKNMIPGARIGANDLYSLLGGLRRPTGKTIYETPVGHVIDCLIEAFAVNDVRLFAPVSDRINDVISFEKEIKEDIERGLFGKTCVHPSQVDMAWKSYLPSDDEIADAERILNPKNPAVFRSNEGMLEKSCHEKWATHLLAREKIHRCLDRSFSD